MGAEPTTITGTVEILYFIAFHAKARTRNLPLQVDSAMVVVCQSRERVPSVAVTIGTLDSDVVVLTQLRKPAWNFDEGFGAPSGLRRFSCRCFSFAGVCAWSKINVSFGDGPSLHCSSGFAEEQN